MEKPNDAKMGTDPPTARRRRRWLLGFEFPLIECFLGSVLVLWGANLAIKAERDAERKREESALKTIILPEIRFEETPFPEAIRQLNTMIHRADPALGEELIEFHANLGQLDEIKITMTFPELPAAETLRYTITLAMMRDRVFGRRIVIVPLHHSREWHDWPRTPIEIPFDWVSWKFYDFRGYEWSKWQTRFRRWLSGSPSDPFQ